MIVWLASYPRSGNTLVRLALHHTFGLRSYSLYDDPLFERLGASTVVGHHLLPAPIHDLATRASRYLVKTHELPPNDDDPAIYAVRDGRDALVSYARYLLAFEPGAEGRRGRVDSRFRRTLRRLIEGEDRFGSWGEHVLRWTGRRTGPTVVVRFEDLVVAPSARVADALSQLGLEVGTMESGDPPTFAVLHERWPEFFRAGRVGAWREEMTSGLHRLFWRRHARAMEAVGYGRGS